jgi:hypothetical protein
MAGVSPEDLQDAIAELHQYLSDQKPPLMVADSVELLLGFPPDFLAAQINAWIGGQSLTAPVADYLFHGAKKISHMADLDLVPRATLSPRLKGLTESLLQYCPPDDRVLLKQNLDRLGQAAQAPPAAPPLQKAPTTAPPAAPPTGLAARAIQRLSVLISHLRPLASAAAPPEQKTELASQFMTTAAVQSRSSQELDNNLAPLREVGVEVATDQLFRTLARSLAGWALPQREGEGAPLVSREQLEAMRRIVSLPEDAQEVARRYREMMHAAMEQFNDGHLGRAVSIFDLAEKLAAEQKVKPASVEALRMQGHDKLDQDRLRRYSERTDYRPQLRRILGFFTALQPPALLAGLNGEPKRDRRHQLLALLEVHEQAARLAAWDLLKASVQEGSQADPFFQMNLVYLLRVISRPPNASVEEEVDAVMRATGRSSPPPLVKQVIAYLAATRHDKAERALITYLKVFESMMLEPETAVYSPGDVEVLLDRTCAGLARYGTPRAWRLLIDHGLKAEARLGSPHLRLAEAGRVDLSSSPDLVSRVVAAVRTELPRGGVMGLMARKGDEKAIALVQALAGTPLPEVQELLQEIESKHGDRPLGEAARKALASVSAVGKPPAPQAALSGDLELFGLPNLLQTVTQSQLSGVLSVLDKEGRTQATLLLERGKYRGGQCGAVRGDAAVYELLERPFQGTFAFVNRDLAGQAELTEPQDLFSLLMEGVRRYDEFKRAAAVVPDGATLKPAGNKPSLPEGADAAFAKLTWAKVATGRPIQECEAELRADGYSVRRLTAHWVEEGSLQVVAAA